MQTLALVPTTLLFHAEMESPAIVKTLNASHIESPEDVGHSAVYNSSLASRPPSFETNAITEILNLAPIAPDLRLHIVHLSAHEALPILREARRKGVKIT